MLGGLDEHDLERRPDVGLKQMPSPGRPIRPAKHHMGMQFWLSILKRDVTHQRENLDLLADGDFAVFLRLPVEVAECRFLKRTDRRESCAARWFWRANSCKPAMASSPASKTTAKVFSAPSS